MDIQKEYATLMEAYNAVYENQEQLDGNILEGSYEDRIAANNKKYDANRKRAAQRAQARNEARARGENVGSSRPERTTYRDSAGVERHHSGARMPKNEEVETDFFDVILEHLVAEGYADTNKAALAIMANMSEEWKQSIVEQYGSIGANMAGAELQRRLELRVREQERKKIEQEKRESSGASSQVKGA